MTNATVATILRRIREEIDEDRDPNTNFWSDRYVIEAINRGMRKVWQTAREAKENWFVRSIQSSDPPFSVYGHAYDPAALAITSGTGEYALPPDFNELLALSAVGTGEEAWPTFTLKDITHSDFSSLANQDGPDSACSYVAEIIWRTEGPRLLLRPTPGTATAVQLDYVQGPKTLTGRDSFEGSGFNDIMLDAVVAYAVLDCFRKQGLADEIGLAGQDFSDKINMVTRSAGPRQVKDAQTVDGFLESEI